MSKCPIFESQDNRQGKKNRYDGHWHSSPSFAYRLSSSPWITPGVKVQKSLIGVWLGLRWPSWLDWEQTRWCIFIWQKYVKVRFAAEVLKWHLKGEFMFEPSSVSTAKNHCHPVCILPNMLQQLSAEGNNFLAENLIPFPIYVPFFILQFHYFFAHNSIY